MFSVLIDLIFGYFFRSVSYKKKKEMVAFKIRCEYIKSEYLASPDVLGNKIVDFCKSNERGNKHLISCLMFLFILFFGVLGFRTGKGLDINVPPKELAYVAAALIAGLVGFLINETNKESEIGKHREKWLSELKSELANYFSDIEEFCYKTKKWIGRSQNLTVESKDNVIFHESLNELKRSINGSRNKIYLFIKTDKDKPEKKVYEGVKDLKKRVEDISNLVDKVRYGRSSYLAITLKKANQLVSFSLHKNIVIVKNYCDDEWLYIKKGHVGFRFKRAILIAAILFIVTMFSGYTVEYYERWV